MTHQMSRPDALHVVSLQTRDPNVRSSAQPDSTGANDAYFVHEAPPSSARSESNGKRRKSSKVRAGRSSSRSSSTQQIRRPVMSESDIDKKRNKLGYQRTSIACGESRNVRRPNAFHVWHWHTRMVLLFADHRQHTAVDAKSDV